MSGSPTSRHRPAGTRRRRDRQAQQAGELGHQPGGTAGQAEQGLVGPFREAGRPDVSAHGGLDDGLQQLPPLVGPGLGCHGRTGLVGKTNSELGRQAGSMLGRSGRRTQGFDDPAVVEAYLGRSDDEVASDGEHAPGKTAATGGPE